MPHFYRIIANCSDADKNGCRTKYDKGTSLYTALQFIGNPITAMFIAAFVAYYVLGIRRNMGMNILLKKTEDSFSSIANILLIIGAGGAFNGILKAVV